MPNNNEKQPEEAATNANENAKVLFRYAFIRRVLLWVIPFIYVGIAYGSRSLFMLDSPGEPIPISGLVIFAAILLVALPAVWLLLQYFRPETYSQRRLGLFILLGVVYWQLIAPLSSTIASNASLTTILQNCSEFGLGLQAEAFLYALPVAVVYQIYRFFNKKPKGQ